MPTIEVRVPAMHAAQRMVDSEAQRFNVLCAGRRTGKSVLSRRRLLRVAAKGRPVAYFAPTYKMLSEYWRETVQEWQPLIEKLNVQQNRILLKGGGSLDMWSLDEPNAARGRKYAHVAIDEAAIIARLQEAWQQVIRPTLSDYQGTADFYSTPRGHNFFYQCFQRGQDEAHPEWISWQLPTSRNPFIKPAEIEAARLELPERVFAQEYLAQFLDDSGGVLRRVRESATATPQDAPIKGHQYVIGADWGQENDFSLFSVLDATIQEQVCIDRSNQVDYPVQMARLTALYDLFLPELIVAEQNSIGRPIIQMMVRNNIPVRPFNTTSASKINGVEALALAFETGALKILPDSYARNGQPLGKIQIEELQAFEMTRTKTGLPDYHAPSGTHDDTVMALMIAWQYARRMAP